MVDIMMKLKKRVDLHRFHVIIAVLIMGLSGSIPFSISVFFPSSGIWPTFRRSGNQSVLCIWRYFPLSAADNLPGHRSMKVSIMFSADDFILSFMPSRFPLSPGLSRGIKLISILSMDNNNLKFLKRLEIISNHLRSVWNSATIRPIHVILWC